MSQGMVTRKIKRLTVLGGCCIAVCVLLYLYKQRPFSQNSTKDYTETLPPTSLTVELLDKKLTRSVNSELNQYNNEAAAAVNNEKKTLVNKEVRKEQPYRSEESRSFNKSLPTPNYCLHVFYYMWYADNLDPNGYSHWNHRYIPHWNPNKATQYPTGAHVPPDDIAASFYPKLGCYSSRSSTIIKAHMEQLIQANIGVAVVSWYPKGQTDQPGAPPPDSLMPLLLDIAEQYNVKVAIHIEPYKGRNPLKVRYDLEYIHKKYGRHPALFKMAAERRGARGGPNNTTQLPVVYVYDSYLSSGPEWANILTKSGPLTIRGSPIDSIVIGLVVKMAHTKAIKTGGFDGFYTYFASDGFSYGSSTRNWPYLSSFAQQSNLIFIPSAGPGYEDTRVRPWNGINTRNRKNGEYYRNMLTKAISTATSIISITSFNEWHEGTQIEPAVPKHTGAYSYRSYEPFTPEYYLIMTAKMSRPLKCSV